MNNNNLYTVTLGITTRENFIYHDENARGKWPNYRPLGLMYTYKIYLRFINVLVCSSVGIKIYLFIFLVE